MWKLEIDFLTDLVLDVAVGALCAVVRPVAVAAVAGLVAPHASERALRVHAELVPRARSGGD